jgi:signal peptidase
VVELAAESLRRTGRLRLRVTGSSMLPAIRPGDVIEVRSRAAAAIQAGAVVLFERGGRLFAHRAVRSHGSRLVTRGDTHEREDGAIAEGELLGEVIEVRRGQRRLAARATAFTRTAALVLRGSPLARRIFARVFAA